MADDKIDYKKLVVAGLEVKDYYWILGLRWDKVDEVDLHFVDTYRETAERLVEREKNVGIEEYGERERIETINKKNRRKIEVNVIHLRKLGAIRG